MKINETTGAKGNRAVFILMCVVRGAKKNEWC